jgi:hypothetical protein
VTDPKDSKTCIVSARPRRGQDLGGGNDDDDDDDDERTTRRRREDEHDDKKDDSGFHPRIAFSMESLDMFMGCERRVWIAVRNRIIALFSHDGGHVEEDDDDDNAAAALFANDRHRIVLDYRLRDNVPLRNVSIHHMSIVRHHLLCAIGDYTRYPRTTPNQPPKQ